MNIGFYIKTPRLKLKPLSKRELFRFLFLRSRFEEEWEVQLPVDLPDPELHEILSRNVMPKLTKGIPLLFNTLWLIVIEKNNEVAGEFCFKGIPDEERSVEIGYAISKKFQNSGYMTESLEYILEWCFSEKSITMVKAETDKDNFASVRVLEKNGFRCINETKNILIWKISGQDWIRQKINH